MKKLSNKRGGSPASNRVMNILPANCNLAKNTPFTPLNNNNVSNVNLYQTTGGGLKYKHRGGSPASNRVMNLLSTNCNIAKNVPFTPVDNSNISHVKLYQTTGGRRRVTKRKKTRRRRSRSRSRSRNRSRKN